MDRSSPENETVGCHEERAGSETADSGAGGRRRRLGVPGRFLAGAILFSVLFAAVHLLGFRTYTSILSGTGSLGTWEKLCGAAYIALYACFVILVPMRIIAAALLKGMEWVRGTGGDDPSRFGASAAVDSAVPDSDKT